ncbi:MAG: hypothetical protein ABFR02_02575 [Campylobacterota bacterium]
MAFSATLHRALALYPIEELYKMKLRHLLLFISTYYIARVFFLRAAQEIKIKVGEIENESLHKLYMIMTAKGYKYPDYISSQKRYALERLPEVLARVEMLK